MFSSYRDNPFRKNHCLLNLRCFYPQFNRIYILMKKCVFDSIKSQYNMKKQNQLDLQILIDESFEKLTKNQLRTIKGGPGGDGDDGDGDDGKGCL
jgi:hypothetical protein